MSYTVPATALRLAGGVANSAYSILPLTGPFRAFRRSPCVRLLVNFWLYQVMRLLTFVWVCVVQGDALEGLARLVGLVSFLVTSTLRWWCDSLWNPLCGLVSRYVAWRRSHDAKRYPGVAGFTFHEPAHSPWEFAKQPATYAAEAMQGRIRVVNNPRRSRLCCVRLLRHFLVFDPRQWVMFANYAREYLRANELYFFDTAWVAIALEVLLYALSWINTSYLGILSFLWYFMPTACVVVLGALVCVLAAFFSWLEAAHDWMDIGWTTKEVDITGARPASDLYIEPRTTMQVCQTNLVARHALGQLVHRTLYYSPGLVSVLEREVGIAATFSVRTCLTVLSTMVSVPVPAFAGEVSYLDIASGSVVQFYLRWLCAQRCAYHGCIAGSSHPHVHVDSPAGSSLDFLAGKVDVDF